MIYLYPGADRVLGASLQMALQGTGHIGELDLDHPHRPLRRFAPQPALGLPTSMGLCLGVGRIRGRAVGLISPGVAWWWQR